MTPLPDGIGDATDASVTSWSSSILLWLGSSKDQDEQHAESSSLKKEQQISQCLSGGSTEKVNMWQLREEALKPGGFVNSSTRKLAWPKLTGAHEELLLRRNNASPQNKVSLRDLQELEYDVEENVQWSIQHHVKLARKEQQQAEEEPPTPSSTTSSSTTTPTKRVTFATPPDLVVASPEQSEELSPPLESITTSPGKDSALMPSSPINTPTTPTTPQYESSSAALLRSKNVALSSHEQRTLTNVVLSALRKSDDVSYVSGLQNLAALLLINLESPSLASVVLAKLSQWHCNTSMTQQEEEMETIVHATVRPLLQQLDPELYQHLVSSDKPWPFSFVAPWINSWFTEGHDNDVKVASRLLDVLLASHAIMPVYISVAILTQNRDELLDTPQANLPAVLKNLILLSHDMENPMHVWESIIENAISYTSLVPLKMLKNMAIEFVGSLMPRDAAMMQQPPEWAIRNFSPTDWSLLQQSRRRSRSLDDILESSSPDDKAVDEESKPKGAPISNAAISYVSPELQAKYPRAVAVSGLEIATPNKRRWVRFGFASLLLIILGVVLVAGCESQHLGNQFCTAIFPGKEAPTVQQMQKRRRLVARKAERRSGRQTRIEQEALPQPFLIPLLNSATKHVASLKITLGLQPPPVVEKKKKPLQKFAGGLKKLGGLVKKKPSLRKLVSKLVPCIKLRKRNAIIEQEPSTWAKLTSMIHVQQATEPLPRKKRGPWSKLISLFRRKDKAQRVSMQKS